jgi:RNA polymerase sigma-70 factor (ECF subfamily)
MTKVIDLILLCKKQDRKGQNLLYKYCFGKMMRICSRYANNKEDAVILFNNGFLKILNGLENYDVDVPFETWSRRVMINSIVDEFRKNRKYKEQMVFKDWQGEDVEEQFVDESKADAKYDTEGIMKLLQMLAPATCKIFNLYAIDGYSHKEISSMLNISEGTSKWHLSEARRILRAKIEGGYISILSFFRIR